MNKKWVFVIVCASLSLALLLPFIPLPFGIKVRVVTTNGMKHCCPETQEAFQIYWKRRGYDISNIPFSTGLETADIIFIIKGEYSVGDVITYRKVKQFKVHRIIEFNSTHFSTINDMVFTPEVVNNNTSILLAKCKEVMVTVLNPELMEKDKCELFNGTLIQSHYKFVDLPVSSIEGKVIFRIPKLGILHVVILCLRNPKCQIIPCITTGECELMGFA
jgi:hypothetical protein